MRLAFSPVCALFAVLVASAAVAQPAPKPRIGWLGSDSAATGSDSGVKDFEQGLRDRKYVDGQDVTVLYRGADGKLDKLGELSNDLVKQKVDVIVTSGVPAAFAAKRATSTIPIIVTEFAVDPVKARLVDSLSRPEGNVTGLTTISEELWPKRLGLLKEIAPSISRLAVLWNPTNPGNTACIQEIGIAAPAMGMRMVPLEVSDSKSLDGALARIVSDEVDAIAICWDSASLKLAKSIGDFALKRRLPTVAPLREYVDGGALISYGASLCAALPVLVRVR